MGNSGSISQTLLLVVLFVAAMAALPWLVRRIQQRQMGSSMAAETPSRVLSAIAVGPQQRVVTIEVGPGHARTVLVLGVTAQQISCLHVLPPQATVPTVPGALATDFAHEMHRQNTASSSSSPDAAGSPHAQ